HITCVYKSGVGSKIYVNGVDINAVQVGTGSITGNIAKSRNQPLFLGCRYGTQDFYTGKIDEAKIYPYALSSQQINQNYLDSKDGLSNISRIVKEETSTNDIWRCDVTPSDGLLEGTTKTSNPLTIVIPHYTLTVNNIGNGIVAKLPDQSTYNQGTSVQLTATADPGWTFAGWSGDLTGTTNPTTITMNSNKTITATFTRRVYTIIASSGSGGTISPAGSIPVNYENYKNFTIAPTTGYHIQDVLVDSTSIGAISYYNFTNVNNNHTIHALFGINSYTITASAGSGGTIIPSGTVTVNYGDYKNFTIAPNTGYHIVDVLVDSSSFGRVNWYNFTNIETSHTISVSFAIDQYTITASAGVGGSITPSGEISATHGEDVLFTITSNIGYHILNVVVDSVSQGAISSYTFYAVTINHTITASFEINQYTIVASAGPDGTITPSGIIPILYDGYQNFTITANSGCHIEDVLVDSVSMSARQWYNFTNVIANHTIAASFTINTYTITASAGAGGSITPSGTIIVNYNSYKNFTIAPNTGHHIQNVLVDSISVGTVTYYNFTNVQANHTISVTFAISQILTDSTFDASVDSADLRTNSTSQDWYESRNDNPLLLTLDTNNTGGNTGKKASIKNYGVSKNVYCTQEFISPQSGTFNVSFDIYIDKIQDNANYDRTGHIYIGNNWNGNSYPLDTARERYVLLAFYDSTPGDTGNDLQLRARTLSTTAQSWSNTGLWPTAASGLSYDTWYTIKVTVNYQAGTYDVNINGTATSWSKMDIYNTATDPSISYISFSGDSEARGDFYVDNVFSPAMNRYQLKTNVVGNGIIQKNPGEATYAPGSTVTLTAIPTTGWHFSGWSGAITGSENPTTITMNNNKTINATFTPDLYTLTIQIQGNGAVNKLPNQETYYLNDIVQLTAIPDTGWSFDHWAEDLTGNENPKNILIDGNKTVIANFSHVPGLQIDANFDSGSLQSYTTNGNIIDLTLSSETLVNTGDQYVYWTYFKAINTLNRNLTFRITNANQIPFLANSGAQLVYSYDGITWNRLANHTYSSGVYTFWKNFTANEVQIATFFPFSYTTMQDYLEIVNASQWATKTSLGKSQQNRDISLLTITDPIVPDATKKVIYIVGRQHASETASSHM
ncbi:MAG: hypothetical protein IMZ53_07180, partial [Thermoplasmata archaeon]|nr:hypothetical protein [Thermoplasmata archaeon]